MLQIPSVLLAAACMSGSTKPKYQNFASVHEPNGPIHKRAQKLSGRSCCAAASSGFRVALLSLLTPPWLQAQLLARHSAWPLGKGSRGWFRRRVEEISRS